MIKTAVMGYGTIGSGVAEILDKNRDVIAGQAGQEVELKYVLDLREFQDSPVADKIVHDFKVIQQDEEVKIVDHGRTESRLSIREGLPYGRQACGHLQ